MREKKKQEGENDDGVRLSIIFTNDAYKLLPRAEGRLVKRMAGGVILHDQGQGDGTLSEMIPIHTLCIQPHRPWRGENQVPPSPLTHWRVDLPFHCCLQVLAGNSLGHVPKCLIHVVVRGCLLYCAATMTVRLLRCHANQKGCSNIHYGNIFFPFFNH